jgi:O-antigen ligase
MHSRGLLSPKFIRLLQLAITLLAVLYMLLIGGTFDATVRFRVQLLNYVAGCALALVWLTFRVAKRKTWQASGLELPLLLFAATQWAALLTSAQPRLGLEWAAGLITWGAAFCIVYDLLASGWPREFVINALYIVAAVLAADGIGAAVGWYANWARLGQWPPVNFRFDGLLGHANLTAGVLNLLLSLVLVRAATGRARARLAFGVLAAAMAATEFFTSSRAGWLACGLSLATLCILLIYRRGGLDWLRSALAQWGRQRRSLRVASIVGLIAAAVGAAWLLAKQAQHITHGSLIDSRLFFWTVAWDLFKRQPLTGSGPDLYPWFYPRYTSIPPEFFAPHAHSLIFQILSGSGLLGCAGLIVLVVCAAWLLWRAWRAAGRPVEQAALMAGLMSVALHNSSDYLFGIPIFPFLVLTVAALDLAPLPGNKPRAVRRLLWLAPALLVPVGIFAFALRASYWNDVGLAEAAKNQWSAAAAALEQAGQEDPGMSLYWEEAAYAETRAGQPDVALPLWEQAARSDPYWAVLPASIGAISQDAAAAAAARALAPESYLFALNAGAIAEAQGNTDLVKEAYTTALN